MSRAAKDEIADNGLSERIAAILQNENLRQNQLAGMIGVTDSYVSAMLSKRNLRISNALAVLIEEKLGYNAEWLMTGQGDMIKYAGKKPGLSDVHKRAIMRIEKMSISQVHAVLAFIDSLEKVGEALAQEEDEKTQENADLA